jgi:hypothetical protein
MVAPLHVPFWQESPDVHESPSLHAVPSVANAFAGQLAEPPLHCAATSHVPEAARQTNVFGRNASGGQAFVVPSHDSATSHGPAADRQV